MAWGINNHSLRQHGTWDIGIQSGRRGVPGIPDSEEAKDVSSFQVQVDVVDARSEIKGKSSVTENQGMVVYKTALKKERKKE